MKTLTDRTIVAAVIMISLFISNINKVYSQEQDFQGIISEMVQENGKLILQPYADAISGSMNSGLYNTAKVNKGFNIYFGIRASGTYINDTHPAVKDANNTLSLIPVATPQLTIGSVASTELSVRYLPKVTIGSYGSVGSWGASIKHGFTGHFRKSPVDAAIQLSYNNMYINNSVGKDMINANSFAVNIEVSKQLSVFTFFTGIQYENTSMDVDYNLTVNNNATNVKTNLDNSNKVRGTFGMNIKLGPFNLNGDYNIGKTNSVSAGFGFSF